MPVGAVASMATPAVSIFSSCQRRSSMRPSSSSPSLVIYPPLAPCRTAAISAFEVSPPNPCRYVRASALVWLNSTIASPSATMSSSVAAAISSAHPKPGSLIEAPLRAAREFEQHLARILRTALHDRKCIGDVAEIDPMRDDALWMYEAFRHPIDHTREHRAVEPRRIQRQLLLRELLLGNRGRMRGEA